MSCSKPLPPFTFDVLCYLNRDQLERFSIICRPIKNLIERYFQSKPYRIFDELRIRGGSYALFTNDRVQWHPNRDDYSTQQFLAGQKCSIDELKDQSDDDEYYSFAEMRPYLGPTVRIKETYIYVVGASIYNPEQMESIAYLWRDGNIGILHVENDNSRIVAEDFKPILNSPTILQCRELYLRNAHFSFKDYKILYSVNAIGIFYRAEEEIDPSFWTEFLEQSGSKPVLVFHELRHEDVVNVLECLKKAFSSAVVPSAFKVVFSDVAESLIEFRETNNTLREKLELKKGLPVEYRAEYFDKINFCYTLERSSI
ncbi:hypothetical protein Ddc_24713 [Ditylenchus destructor]|nr:hypothetical protein Ddc_24713 [Ditylenchus destructor]